MPALTIISGAPGTGKTTVAALLARDRADGVHIASDVFYTFPAHPIPPSRPEAHAQNTTVIIAMTRAAAAFASRGYDVFLDGIIGPWFVSTLLSEISARTFPIHYVVLRAPLEVALERVARRSDGTEQDVVTTMHRELSDLGHYARHTVETADRPPEEVAAEITRRTDAGQFVLD